MVYGSMQNPLAPRSIRWKSLSVLPSNFPWEPQAASCCNLGWILLSQSTCTALAISAAVCT